VHEEVGAPVHPDRDARVVGGCAQAGDIVRVLLRGAYAAALRVDGVLDVETDAAGLDEPGDKVGGLLPVSGLQVDGHRHVDRRDDRPDGGEHLLEGLSLVVAGSSGIGEGMAADRERREPGGDGCPCGPDVPDGRQHERLVLGVQLLEALSALDCDVGGHAWDVTPAAPRTTPRRALLGDRTLSPGPGRA
jgi:hypothetical protein